MSKHFFLKTTTTPIIPSTPTFAKVKGVHELHKEAICVFAATGFFLDQDTYWKDEVVLRPGCHHELNDAGFLEKSTPYFAWHHRPKEISFEEALEQFSLLFEAIIAEQVQEDNVILPLSGGLDSRSQAAALFHLKKNVSSYSYQFKGGYPEVKLAHAIAKACGFSFQEFTIKEGYLWDVIAQLAEINGCYSEFTHPRQMAIIDKYEAMGSIFSLGHWGDVLFDKGAPLDLEEKDLVPHIVKKVIKKGGMDLAEQLWEAWELAGSFKTYLVNRIQALLDGIDIDHVGAKMRAFKSLYWAPRWTSTNLSIFAAKRPISLPYYDNRMCAFICSIPEEYLADRKLQLAYIKKRSTALAKITWQDQKPYNLLNYHRNKAPYNLPYRVIDKLQREAKGLLGNELVQRNWELQFVGSANEQNLKGYLFNSHLSQVIPTAITEDIYRKFRTEDAVFYSHPVSMLLTLSLKMQQIHGG